MHELQRECDLMLALWGCLCFQRSEPQAPRAWSPIIVRVLACCVTTVIACMG